MAEDLFGAEIPDEEDAPLEETPAEDAPAAEVVEAPAEGDEPLANEGEEPADPVAAQKYWQAAYTKSRQKDREKYSKIETEHKQFQQVLGNFYKDEAYAKQVLAQRFPTLAAQILGQTPGQASAPSASPTTGLTDRLKQRLGEFGFLADGIGAALEEEIQARVDQRVSPLEQKATQQTAASRKAEEDRLLSEMDGRHPGWEDSYGAQMAELDEFLASEALTHPKFGSKYELFYRILHPDSARVDATRAMGDAARRRTGVSRTGRMPAPNTTDLIRKAESNMEAFQLAAKAALEEGA